MQLEKGQNYEVKPVDIVPKMKNGSHKTFPRNGQTRYVYDMTCQFKSGEIMVLEYTPTSPDVSGIALNMFQWVKVVMINTVGAEVEPFDPALAGKQYNQTPEVSSTFNKVQTGAPRNMPEGCGTLNVQGLAVTFASAYAKDLLVAEMKNWNTDREIQDSDIERMLGWQDKINDAMCRKIIPTI